MLMGILQLGITMQISDKTREVSASTSEVVCIIIQDHCLGSLQLDIVSPDAGLQRANLLIRNLSTSGLDSGSSWLDGVNSILMQQEPNSPKQDYWNQRAIASLANTLITVVEPVPTPLLSSMLLLQL
jgi:hypothetical protein